MNYLFKGSIYGYLCADYAEPLAGNEVRLYLPWRTEEVLQNTVASTKDTFRLVTAEENSAREKLFIASGKVDEKGNFELVLDEKYSNTAFDIDFVCGTVPRTPPKPPRSEPVQFHLTTVYPRWRLDKRQENYYFQWQYGISANWWCQIRGRYFDAWVIYGHMRVCDSRTPIPGLKITAWDADFLRSCLEIPASNQAVQHDAGHRDINPRFVCAGQAFVTFAQSA